ncbi:MAG: hypothetical protein EHM33_21705 [Chloroflexi bacterium]|nr:MAG: hypothetical protein EHM33_21705 [Chloroflexota bacterium]
MNKFFKTLSLLAAIAFFATACIPPVVEVAQAAPAEVSYRAVLGKSTSDRDVADFISSNDCTQTGSFQLCRPAGLALWTDADQIVETAYLYVSNSDGFAAYKGALPLGLAPGDTMASVEEKLGQPKVAHALQAGWKPGLPDEGRSPDHKYFWAIYKRFGVTVIYNTPAANDRNATIHAILVNK